MIFGDERRGANSSCILALIQLKMDSVSYNKEHWGLLVGRGALLHDGRCVRSARNVFAHDAESCARLGHGGFLLRDPRTHTTHSERPKTRSHGTPAAVTHPRARRSWTRPRHGQHANAHKCAAHGHCTTQTHVHEHMLMNQLTYRHERTHARSEHIHGVFIPNILPLNTT